MSNLITGKEARDAAINGALLLASAVECTLGPKGKNVVLYEDGGAYITKDGISIAKKVVGKDAFEESGVQILRQASLRTAEEAGDGTTTSIVLAKAILQESLNKEYKCTLPDLFKGMDAALDNFNSVLPFYTKEVGYNYTQLKYIATTSTNNDEKLGHLVADAFVKAGPNGCVILDNELHNYCHVEESKGIVLNKGCYDYSFISDRIKQNTVFNDCFVVFYKGKLDKIADISDVFKYEPLADNVVVIATDFSATVISTMLKNTMVGKIKFLPIMAEGMAESKLKHIEDLIAVTGSTTTYGDKVVLGRLKGINASMDKAVLTLGDTDKKMLNDLIAQYNNNIEKFPDSADYFKKRLAQLTGKLFIIRAGGATEVEAKEVKDRLEDPILLSISDTIVA